MTDNELVIRAGKVGSKIIVKTGEDEFLFAVVTDGEGKVTIQDKNGNNIGDGGYIKPDGGIPDTDLSESVQASLGKADTAYQKPSGGIATDDLSEGVTGSLGKADSSLQPGTLPVTPPATGSVMAFTYDPTTQEYGWREVLVPTE